MNVDGDGRSQALIAIAFFAVRKLSDQRLTREQEEEEGRNGSLDSR
jgi:hypothetical protein